jgi:hypothetical protein
MKEGMLTEEEFVLVHDIPDPEVQSSKCHNLRLNNAIQDGDDENQDGLWVY